MIPAKYVDWFEALSFQEISFGYGGLVLCHPSEIDDAQVGYSRSSQREFLGDDEAGLWNANWIVIGNQALTGDPLIMDTGNPNFPIMTDMHGEGSWDPRLIATSLDVFGFALKAIQKLSVGRENPVALERNPLPKEAREQVLEAIQRENNSGIDMEFWSLLLEA